QIPENLDARSLCPLIHGKTPDDWPDSCYAEYHGEVWGYDTQRMVRTQRWKYVYHPNGLDELYDLDLDPFELQNLVTVTEKNDVLQEMKARLAGWNEHTNDMFQWDWVKWNFPEPAKPGKADPEKLPLTTSVL
ncbi:MAG: DUF4976 domain-containing protein, partial [Lentisphaeria bacterium]|nr:DUF4976 domain-containing protein [Lentisphaeria bacterium]